MNHAARAGRRLGWLLPVGALLFAGDRSEPQALEGHVALSVILVGFVAGALWQLAYRRDLTDRLTGFVVGMAGCVVFLVLVPHGYVTNDSGTGLALAGILAGLVVAEQGLRLRALRKRASATRAPLVPVDR